ncbi:MAG: glycosyltransferase family 4 protein [Elusimicrobia bacterium]|nr:glycosyltransferase family 4 protein [Elusimicrobiota bacterium]
MKERKLRVAQIHWGFPPIIGGVETHLTIMLPEMVKRGHKVGLLTGAVEGEKVRCKYKGTEIYRSPLFDLNWLYKRGLEKLEEELEQIYNKFFDELKPDIVHTHNMHYFSEVHAKILEEICRKKGIPLILTAHNVWDDMTFLKLTRDINWTHIIAVSHYIKRELIGVGFDDRKITVVHHGIDTEVFRYGVDTKEALKNHPRLKGRKVIFHPARMGIAKGCDVSIKAINLVKSRFPDVLLVLAGTKNIIDWGDMQQKDIAYFVNLIKAFDLKKNVYINVFKLKEMPALYNLSRLSIYPSTASEPFGLTMLESLACGKPIVVTNMGGMPEIIRDEINGYVIPVKDFENLATRIIHLLANDRVRKRLGRTGNQMVRVHYTKEIMTDVTLDIYKQVLGFL